LKKRSSALSTSYIDHHISIRYFCQKCCSLGFFGAGGLSSHCFQKGEAILCFLGDQMPQGSQSMVVAKPDEDEASFKEVRVRASIFFDEHHLIEDIKEKTSGDRPKY